MNGETLADKLLFQQFDEYRLDTLLGQGGMARVYRGFDIRLKRWAAIKVIDTPLRSDPTYAARFEREAQAIAQLRHPHIVGVYRYGEIDGLLYIAMEYVEGDTLETYLATHQSGQNNLPSEEVSRIIRQICLALDYAHAKGVVHRDVKPSNIMLDKDGNIILTDFGLVMLDTQQTRGEIFGTPYYAAPEQVVSSADAVPQSDLYAVGIILYEMFTARLPFHATHPHDVALLHLTERPPSPRDINPSLSLELETVILKTLAKDPQDRYQTGADLADMLDQALKVTSERGLALIAASNEPEDQEINLQPLDPASPSIEEANLPQPPSSNERKSPQRQSAKKGKLMTPHYRLKNIQALLTELTEDFTEEELRQLCFNISDFGPVHRQLSQSNGKVEIVQRLLEYAEQTLQLDELLDLAKAHNPTMFDKHKPYYEYITAGKKDFVGNNLGKYHIVERLGQGGMADVYKAYQSGLARYVAIKIIHSHLADNEEFIERFESEAMAVAGLRHPNIIQVFDFDREEDRYYMVMEFIAGPTLETELKNRKTEGQLFPLPEIVEIFKALADAIDYAHSQGVIHRDLKPGNIMFTSRRRLVLTDFGIARISSVPSFTVTNAVVGTPAYMSPEQATGLEINAQSDIYSLGVILYELVTGRIPFEGDNPVVIMMNLVNGSYPLPTTINPDLPEAIEQVILRAMSHQPDERYHAAGEMAHALQTAMEIGGNLGPLTRRVDSSFFKQHNKKSAETDPKAVVRADDNRPDQAKNKALQKPPLPEIEIPSSSPLQTDDRFQQKPEQSGSVINITSNTGQVTVGGAYNIQLGDITGGQVSIGSGPAQSQPQPDSRKAMLNSLHRIVADLKTRIETETPPEKRQATLERLVELEEAIIATRPDLDTIGYVKNWFAKNQAGLADSITALITQPVVKNLIAAAGDALAQEFSRRFQDQDY